MKVLELNSIKKHDGYIYYIHHYTANAKIEFLTKEIVIPISFTVEINPFGMKRVDLDPIPREVDYPVLPITKSLKEFIDKLAVAGALPEV